MKPLKQAIHEKDWQIVNAYLTTWFSYMYGSMVCVRHLGGYIFTVYNAIGVPVYYVSYAKKWGKM